MQNRVIALGFFDGVHLGHAALLVRVRARAAELGAVPAVLTFDTHPGGAVTGDAVPLINALDARIELIERIHGISDVIVVPFDAALRAMPWDRFVAALQRDYRAIHVVCGHNYHFGYRGEGNAHQLVDKCRTLGMGADVIPEIALDGVSICSTYIRALLQAGEMERAAQFLGHPHTLLDTVRHGQRLGRTWGMPTINMEIPNGVLHPPRGVYVTRVFLPHSDEGYRAVTNVGVRPTVSSDGSRVTIESHILNFDGDLYDQRVRVEFHHYLRPELKFADITALQAQIQQDIADAEAYFVSLQILSISQTP